MPAPRVADPDPFDLLGVTESSSEEAINAAWRRRIRKCHPDYATGDADRERRLAASIALNKAHDVLLDPALKAEAVLERHRRTGASAGAGHPPPAGSRPVDEWAGTRWSAFRGGGHPEDRETWSYSGPIVAPAPSAEPPGWESLVRRTPGRLRIVVFAMRIFGDGALAVLHAAERVLMRNPFDPGDPD